MAYTPLAQFVLFGFSRGRYYLLIYFQIRCEIRAKYNTHHNNTWTKAKSSEIFYAGIEVSIRGSDRQRRKTKLIIFIPCY